MVKILRGVLEEEGARGQNTQVSPPVEENGDGEDPGDEDETEDDQFTCSAVQVVEMNVTTWIFGGGKATIADDWIYVWNKYLREING